MPDFSLTAFVNGFTQNLDTVDDGDDGGIDRDEFQPLRGTRGTALAKEDEFPFPGADGINRDDGVLAVLELGRILVVDELGTEEQKLPADHELVFFRGYDLTDDFC